MAGTDTTDHPHTARRGNQRPKTQPHPWGCRRSQEATGTRPPAKNVRNQAQTHDPTPQNHTHTRPLRPGGKTCNPTTHQYNRSHHHRHRQHPRANRSTFSCRLKQHRTETPPPLTPPPNQTPQRTRRTPRRNHKARTSTSQHIIADIPKTPPPRHRPRPRGPATRAPPKATQEHPTRTNQHHAPTRTSNTTNSHKNPEQGEQNTTSRNTPTGITSEKTEGPPQTSPTTPPAGPRPEGQATPHRTGQTKRMSNATTHRPNPS